MCQGTDSVERLLCRKYKENWWKNWFCFHWISSWCSSQCYHVGSWAGTTQRATEGQEAAGMASGEKRFVCWGINIVSRRRDTSGESTWMSGLLEYPHSPEDLKPGMRVSLCRTWSTVSLISILELKYCRNIWCTTRIKKYVCLPWWDFLSIFTDSASFDKIL